MSKIYGAVMQIQGNLDRNLSAYLRAATCDEQTNPDSLFADMFLRAATEAKRARKAVYVYCLSRTGDGGRFTTTTSAYEAISRSKALRERFYEVQPDGHAWVFDFPSEAVPA